MANEREGKAGEDETQSVGTGGLAGTDAGSPGGMGGAGVSGATGTGRPQGGMSPVEGDDDKTDDAED
jgi:hypothetical protein